ncbi:chromatin structure-remodeling complex subunit RSC7 [Aspergillus clavatus NRRL 1]|uniref:Nuclear localization protein NPL6, putative n=1 Tax=Aspergillus clavatus (strain ATCC 1007 / CBS 513.65 / DSM 816 / NCTC 3887 / NRRL 1 / QM 1276 / 107) TaxID=344612 RepID=A1CR22_ASPCL|nr:nuclear localization protein NPL6, putative [Aspergillus clavatus NRRL 1]EAW08093.1 nuclear localization protein NPL6, putative [Aspergillus clavatus NRRL 1]
MARKLRAAAQAAAKSMKNLPPPLPEASDEEMVDVPPSRESSPVEDPGDPSDKDSDAEPEPQPPQEEEEAPVAAETPTQESTVQESNPPSQADTPTHNPGRISAIPRKRRPGRPPKNRPPDWDAPDGSAPPPAHSGTPAKRRRGRPAASGGRWARNRGPSHVTQVPIDKEGNMMDVIDDEVALPPDLEGDTKVDKNGVLKDGREYRVRTFTILNRGERLYMLSTEPARCIGFRDSYLFFQKHKLLFKIIIDDEAKRDLIERDIIPHSYKGRAIGVVTARSVFREFGAKIIVGGRKILDDYNVQAARERGDVEGELAVPEDRLPAPGEPYNKNQYVAWHGASSVYHTNAPSLPLPTGKVIDSKKRKVTVTGDNWMLEHAREASTFNSVILNARRANLDGIYDIHTNAIHYPKVMQPSHARWERVPPPDPRIAARLAKGLSTLSLTNGTDEAEAPPQAEEEQARGEAAEPSTEDPTIEPAESIFSAIPAGLSRRFAIHDTVFETPPYSNMGIPGPDGDVYDLGANGLISAANSQHPEFVSPEILAELPPECKDALVEAAAREWEWKSQWHSEAVDGSRTTPLKSYAWFP